MMSKWKEYGADRLPVEAGVYAVFRSTGRLAYVGQSKDIRERFRQHRSMPPWGIYASGLRVRVFPVKAGGERKIREARLIRRLRPDCNRNGKI
jgi:excinuclease UvrABC nuclease subunit